MESKKQLTNLDDTSVGELQEVSNSIKKYVDEENDNTLQYALKKINHDPNLLQRLFPSKFDKMYSGLAMKQVQNVFEAKERMFEIYTGIQLEIARQKGDTLIATTGMHLQEQLTLFAETKIFSVSSSLESSRNDFMGRMKRQLQSMDEYKDFPELSEPYHKSLKDEIRTYFSFVLHAIKSNHCKNTLIKIHKTLLIRN